MKLVRYGPAGKEKPGIIGEDGKIRDLSRVVKDIDGEMLASGGLAKIKKLNLKRMKPVAGKPRLGPCIGKVGNFIAIGLNYSDHAAEAGMPIPKEPVIFNKATTSICGPNDDTLIPRESTKLDYEVELGIVIGKRARYLDKDKAMSAVAGYCGTRARAARPSGRSGRGLSPRMRSATRRISTCGATSTASAGRPATPGR
jgi:2-keto-4-pentenoate hydratase/2-oxohepta-3-ene-1,7-dioic acid hydratase in catechol pathway